LNGLPVFNLFLTFCSFQVTDLKETVDYLPAIYTCM